MLGISFETSPHNPVERWSYRTARLVQIRGILLENGRRDLDGRLAVERSSAPQHFVQDDAEGEHIRPVIGRLPTQQFGRQITDRPHDQVRRRPEPLAGRDRVGAWWSCQLGEPEIDNLHPPIGRHQQVFRLEIAMHDPFGVGRCETARDLLRVVERLPLRQRAAIQLPTQI